MRIAKWGNSLAVRLPVSIVEELHLEEGDEVELVRGEYDTFIVYRYDEPEKLLQRIRRFRGRMPQGFVVNRDDAHER
jgi:antitoxin MazE